MKKILSLLVATGTLALAQEGHIQPSSQPSKVQQEMIDRSYGMFIHFGINTYSGKEWTDGTLNPKIYNPTKLDTDQWAKTAKDAGMTYVILITKHHEGFCLWDSPHTEYDVASSPVKTDVVKAMAASCKKYGIKLGLYYSLWDRNWKNGVMRGFKPTLTKKDSDEYVEYMKKQLTELLTNYGDVCELWFDGGWIRPRAEWKTEEIYAHVKKLQPNCQVGINWSIAKHGNLDFHKVDPPDYRQGQPLRYAGDFRLGDPERPVFPDNKLYSNDKGQLIYMPFESTITINKFWFWHPRDKGLLTVPELLPLFERATAQSNVLILNSPPNREGLMDKRNIDRFKELATALGAKPSQRTPLNLAEGAEVYATSVFKDQHKYEATSATDGNPDTRWAAQTLKASFVLQWDNPQSVNFIRMREYEDRIEAFNIEAMVDGEWKKIAEGSSIGSNRIVSFPKTTTTNLRINFTECNKAPSLQFLGAGLN